MFTTFQDFYKDPAEYFLPIPKSLDEVTHLTSQVKSVMSAEVQNAQTVYSTYEKAFKGEATVNDITAANKKAQDLMVTARFACLMTIPGMAFALPGLSKLETQTGVTLIPQSVKEEFKL